MMVMGMLLFYQGWKEVRFIMVFGAILFFIGAGVLAVELTR